MGEQHRRAHASGRADRKNALCPLELAPDADQGFIRYASERRAELRQEQDHLAAGLCRLEQQATNDPNADLVAALPTGDIDISQLSESPACERFAALQQELRYNDLSKQRRAALRRPLNVTPTANHPFPRPAARSVRARDCGTVSRLANKGGMAARGSR